MKISYLLNPFADSTESNPSPKQKKSYTRTRESYTSTRESDIAIPSIGSTISFPTDFHPTRNQIFSAGFDGEKTAGELGHIYDLKPDHLKLRMRAYELDLKTDIVKLITGKFFKWCVGTGLKLQLEPEDRVLRMLGFDSFSEQEINNREHFFNLWAKSKLSDYQGRDNLHKKANDTFKTAFLGGDALVVLRLESSGLKVQLVDGEQIATPLDDKGKGDGNTIRHGIEFNSKGQHIAFWVKAQKENTFSEFKRIKAKDSKGNLRAWMVYGSKHRIDHHRGIPNISSILEKVSKLDRFVESSVSKAEKVADILYSFEHDEISTGENPISQLSAKKTVEPTTQFDSYEESGRTANQLRQSTSATVLNLPRGSRIKSLANESETNFNEFYQAVFRSLCASVDVPPEVALQMYEQSYSSSRAAINMWEHIIEIYRSEIIIENFYKPILKFWMYYNSLTDTLNHADYERAVNENNLMALEGYYNCRFTGKKMPHIDPLKEAKAIRELLGKDSPLINHEQATEMANGGDWLSNYNKYKEEIKNLEKEDNGNTTETE